MLSCARLHCIKAGCRSNRCSRRSPCAAMFPASAAARHQANGSPCLSSLPLRDHTVVFQICLYSIFRPGFSSPNPLGKQGTPPPVLLCRQARNLGFNIHPIICSPVAFACSLTPKRFPCCRFRVHPATSHPLRAGPCHNPSDKPRQARCAGGHTPALLPQIP